MKYTEVKHLWHKIVGHWCHIIRTTDLYYKKLFRLYAMYTQIDQFYSANKTLSHARETDYIPEQIHL